MHATLRTTLAILSTLVVAGAAMAEGPLVTAEEAIPGRYIVVLRQGVARGPGHADVALPEVAEVARELAGRHGAAVRRSFTHALPGFVVSGDDDLAWGLAAEPWVDYVEQDGRVRLAGTQVDPPSWGLDRLDQRDLPLDGSYLANHDGSGVDVYVIDSGIRSTHQDFGARVDTVAAFTAIDDGRGTEDCNGHGTAVAGLIGGASYGVAKGVTLHPVRVVDCAGTGAISDLIAGIDWITAQRGQTSGSTKEGRGGKGGTPPPAPAAPAVANLSLVSGGSWALDEAVGRAISAGVVVVAAAGNDASDACQYSPGRVASAITVGASSEADAVWTSSNGGACVDLFAPGVAVATTSARGDVDTTLFTGTSAAAPHAAGTAAILLGADPAATPAEVENAIKVQATADVLVAVPLGSPNRLLFSADAGSDPPPVASFTWSCRGSRCSFDGTGSSDNTGIVDWSWNLGDGNVAAGSKLTYRYQIPGPVTVTLTVTDAAGQSTSVSREVAY